MRFVKIFKLFQWNVTPTNLWDWDALRKRIAAFGVRNSLLIAPMPTASTAQILGNNESIEPYTSNIYCRRVLSGDFQVCFLFKIFGPILQCKGLLTFRFFKYTGGSLSQNSMGKRKKRDKNPFLSKSQEILLTLDYFFVPNQTCRNF